MTSTLPATVAPPILRLWRYGARFRRRVALATLFSTINKIADVFPELLIGAAVDVIVRADDSFVASIVGDDISRFQQLVILAVINALVWLVESASEYAYQLLWRNLGQTVEHELRNDAYAHIQELDVAFFENTTTGNLLSVLNDDINQLERFLDTGAAAIIGLFWNIVIVGAVFFVTSWQLAMLAFLPIPIIVLGSLRFQRRLGPYYKSVRERVGELSATLNANLGGISTIKAFATEKLEAGRIREASEHYRISNRDAIRFSSAFVPVIRLAILTGFTFTLIIGGKFVLDGRLEVGLYSVLVFMTQRLLWPLTRIGETLDLYQRAMASTRRVLDLLDTSSTMRSGTVELPASVDGAIRLTDVTFAYMDGADVLRRVSMEIPPGETHAIVGATGSGKSTLMRLLLRFHDPTSGNVTVDGHDLRSLTDRSLRQVIGYVSQDVFLFDGSIRDNIAYGVDDASDEQVERAARLAEVHEFVLGFADGYDTLVGERGVKLSGGQRQRIAIARAILRDPRILLLDEATSAVDNETEAAIQRSLDHVGIGRTVVVVAHRLSTIRHADRIWVLSSGVIAESGTHDELVADEGIYAALWKVQTGETTH